MAQKQERTARTKPDATGGGTGAARAARDAFQTVSAAQRTLTDGVNDISNTLNDALGRACRDWVSAQFNAQAKFQDHQDWGQLQQELQDVSDAYAKETRTLTQGALESLADTYRSYVGAIKEAVAAVDVNNADANTLNFLAQSLSSAAAIAAQQPPTARRAGG